MSPKKIHRHNVVQYLLVASGESYHGSPKALQENRDHRNVSALADCGDAAKENTIFRHRKVDAGRCQDGLAQKTER